MTFVHMYPANSVAVSGKAEVFWSSEKKRGLGKIILEGKIEGKRERGRPRRTLSDGRTTATRTPQNNTGVLNDQFFK